MNAISVENLVKSFSAGLFKPRKFALNGITFSVPKGEVTGFLGGNGAGKTTALSCILNLLQPDSGLVRFFGGHPLSSDLKKKIGFLPERNFSYDHLTGYEFVKYCYLLSSKATEAAISQRVDQELEKLGLVSARNQRLRTYSKGMLQKIGLIQATINDPDLVILDEPMSGLDPDGRKLFSDQIVRLRDRGASVFFSSHILGDVEKLCSYLVIVKGGKLLFEGPMTKLFAQVPESIAVQSIDQNSQMPTEKSFGNQRDAIAHVSALLNRGETLLSYSTVKPSLEEVFARMAFDIVSDEMGSNQ